MKYHICTQRTHGVTFSTYGLKLALTKFQVLKYFRSQIFVLDIFNL